MGESRVGNLSGFALGCGKSARFPAGCIDCCIKSGPRQLLAVFAFFTGRIPRRLEEPRRISTSTRNKQATQTMLASAWRGRVRGGMRVRSRDGEGRGNSKEKLVV